MTFSYAMGLGVDYSSLSLTSKTGRTTTKTITATQQAPGPAADPGEFAPGTCRTIRVSRYSPTRGKEIVDQLQVWKQVGDSFRWVDARAADRTACAAEDAIWTERPQPPAKPCSPEGARRRDFRESHDTQSICVDGKWVVVGAARDSILQKDEDGRWSTKPIYEEIKYGVPGGRKNALLLLGGIGLATVAGVILLRKKKKT